MHFSVAHSDFLKAMAELSIHGDARIAQTHSFVSPRLLPLASILVINAITATHLDINGTCAAIQIPHRLLVRSAQARDDSVRCLALSSAIKGQSSEYKIKLIRE